MTSLYPPLVSPLLPGPQAPGTQKHHGTQDCSRQRLLLSCHLQDLLSAGTTESTSLSSCRPLVTEKVATAGVKGSLQEAIAPGPVDAQQSARFAERLLRVRDPAERKASLRKVGPHTWKAAESKEASLKDQPLLLLGSLESEADDTASRVVLWDESRRCFASHWPSALPSDFCSHSFQALMTHAPWEPLHSKKGQVTRETCWYVRKGCRCDYTYGIARVRAKRKQTKAFQAAMEMLLEEVMRRSFPWLPKEAWPNCANLNLYTEAWQSVGWHADDESLFMGKDKDCPIISVSLGARREFWLALRHEGNCMDPHLKSIVEVDLCDGDIFTMEGLCQKHCVHFVPCDVRNVADARTAEARSRINVTWRWIRDHKQRCPQHVEGHADFFFESHGQPWTREPTAIVSAWAGSLPMAWKVCAECDHDAWRGGRNCIKHQKQWLCRLCYQHALSGAPPQQKMYTPRERGPRRPGQAVIQARAAAEADEMMADTTLQCGFNGFASPFANFNQVDPIQLQALQIQALAQMNAFTPDLRPTFGPDLATAFQAPANLVHPHLTGGQGTTKVSYYPVQSQLQ
eukprot:symbB.v1.2.007028.t1/scaffold428.1/size206322/3